MNKISSALIKEIYQPRDPASHKGNHGHALLIAGISGKMGAAVISATACLRTGPGLLTVLIPKNERTIIQTSLPEAMTIFNFPSSKEMNNYAALGIGPGMGTDSYCKEILKQLLNDTKDLPLVIDADALNVLAGNKSLLKKLPAGTMLTPHIKEFDRLFGVHDKKEKRIETAKRLAEERNLIIVLKDATTLITNGKETYLNEIENAGLAKGGSGDALLGMILALRCQNYSALDAAILGVHLHSSAATICNVQQSPESMLITDVIKCIGAAFRKIK